MITILLQRPGQTIPRPVGRVSPGLLGDPAEGRRAVHAFISDWVLTKFSDEVSDIAVDNIDTDKPVARIHHTGGYAYFYAFTEED